MTRKSVSHGTDAAESVQIDVLLRPSFAGSLSTPRGRGWRAGPLTMKADAASRVGIRERSSELKSGPVSVIAHSGFLWGGNERAFS